MKLPNPERAVVELTKVRDYCLNPNHDDGKHKARVFASALGIRRSDAGWLRDCLLEAASGDAELVAVTTFGSLHVIDFRLRSSHGEAMVRSGWIVCAGENFPRLTTCFVKKEKPG